MFKFWRRSVNVDLGRCPTCRAPGAGPLVHRGRVFGVCDVDGLRWLLPLTPSDITKFTTLRLGYRAADDRRTVAL